MTAKQVKTKRVVAGIGGIFFKARDPAELSTWYRKHLGINIKDNVALFTWRSAKPPTRTGHTVWSLFPAKTRYFRREPQQFMINYRVNNLRAVLAKLRRERVRVAKKVEELEYGKFAWVQDSEGNWLELWEPPRKYSAPEEGIPME